MTSNIFLDKQLLVQDASAHSEDGEKTENVPRLIGGADSGGENSNPMATNQQTQVTLAQNPSRMIDQREVDEIIKCAMQNLQDAGRALATLGENHEQELKNIVMEFAAHLYRKIDEVKRKLEATKHDLTTLQRALINQRNNLLTKNQQLRNFQDQIVKLTAEKAACEKTLNEQLLRVNPLSLVASAPPADSSDASYHNLQPPVRYIMPPSNEATLRSQGVVIDRMTHSAHPTSPDPADIAVQGPPQVPAAPIPASELDISRPGNVPLPPRIVSAIFGPQRPSVAPSAPPNGATGPPAAVPPVQVQDQRPSDITDVPAVEELERELAQLRRENERMRRDHAEYEAAMERALLQGVSSMNAEALKILKNPPFICYKPCEPCNHHLPSAAATNNRNSPCVLQTVGPEVCDDGAKNAPRGSRDVSSQPKKIQDNFCHSPGVHDGPDTAEDSMLFFLPHQSVRVQASPDSAGCSVCPGYTRPVTTCRTGGGKGFKSHRGPRDVNFSRDAHDRECIREYIRVNNGMENVSGPPRRCDPRYRGRKFFNS